MLKRDFSLSIRKSPLPLKEGVYFLCACAMSCTFDDTMKYKVSWQELDPSLRKGGIPTPRAISIERQRYNEQINEQERMETTTTGNCPNLPIKGIFGP
jgi:hypothetical protein